MKIYVTYCDDHLQFERIFEVADGATVTEALEQINLSQLYPNMQQPTAFGVFSKKVNCHARLKDGDRLELYLPLKHDPKELRRRRAGRAS